MDRTAQSYQHDYFQRLRRRTFSVQAMAPLALVLVAAIDAHITGTPLLAGTRRDALLIGIGALSALMLAMSRIVTIRSHAVASIAILCVAELSLVFVVTPTPESVHWIMPILLAIPLAAAPFWIWQDRVIASCALCYACAAIAVFRADSGRDAVLVFAGEAVLFSCLSIAVFRSVDRLRRSAYEFQVRLENEARHDSLTGLLSRRRFLQQGEIVRHEAIRRGHAISLCFLDLDHFKQVNDLHGHAAGDRALSRVAECMLAQMPTDALLARMGGEEFVMLLPGCDTAAAQNFAEQLRISIQEQDMGGFALSVSAGVAEHRPGETLGQTLHRADVALLDAKQRGRNRVEVAAS